MKGKFRLMWRVGLALVLVLSLSLVMATPVAASHTSTATVEFHIGESQLVGEASVLDVVVTNAAASLGIINEVKIDFSLTDFTATGEGVEPTNWTGVVDGSVITYTAAAGAEILADASLTFYPTVTNPAEPGVDVTRPTVTTSDPGNKATVTVDTDIVVTAQNPGAVGNDISIAVTVSSLDLGGSSATVEVSEAAGAITVDVVNDNDAANTGANTETVTRKAVADALNMAASDTLTGTDYTGSDIGDEAVAVTITDDVTGLVVGSGGSDNDAAAVTEVNLADGEPEEQSYVASGTLDILEFAVTAVPTDDTSGTPTDYVISFTTLTEIVATTGTITITFPSGYDIPDLVEGDIGVEVATVTYDPLAIAIDAVAGTVTITADAAIIADKAVVVTAASHVKNPPTSGTYDIAVLISGGDEGSGEVTIIPAAFGVVAGAANTVTAGTAFAVTVTAQNADEGSDTGYAGDHFITFTPAGATGTIPAFELISFADGEGISPANFILTVATETPTITAEDVELSITGTSAAITINPATLVSLTISATTPGTVVAGVAFASDITVTALDADLNTKTDYVGTVTWSSSDESESVELPADYPFTAEDEGVKVFPGSEFILTTADVAATITVADGEVEALSNTIEVTPADAAYIEVVALPDVIQADDNDTSTITATAKDAFGNVDTNCIDAVDFATSLGTLTGVGDFVAGEESRALTSTDVGTAIIKVTSGDFDPVTVEVKLLADIVSSITVTVDKDTILNNGADERIITATYNVATVEGADYTVTFTTTPSVGVTLSETEVDPVAGVATTTLTTTIGVAPNAIVVTATGTGVTDSLALEDRIDVALGTHPITLSQGWNLISLPLVPVDDSVDMVLAGLIDADTVIQVRAYNASDKTWSIWASTGPYALNPTLTEMGDGLGFWVEMSNGDILTATGCVLPAPPETPPTYSVYTGWNLIGFKSLGEVNADIYLGQAVMPTFEMMYGYNAATGIYGVVDPTIPDNLVPGQGYWLAVNTDGTIYP